MSRPYTGAGHGGIDAVFPCTEYIDRRRRHIRLSIAVSGITPTGTGIGGIIPVIIACCRHRQGSVCRRAKGHIGFRCQKPGICRKEFPNGQPNVIGIYKLRVLQNPQLPDSLCRIPETHDYHLIPGVLLNQNIFHNHLRVLIQKSYLFPIRHACHTGGPVLVNLTGGRLQSHRQDARRLPPDFQCKAMLLFPYIDFHNVHAFCSSPYTSPGKCTACAGDCVPA